MGDDAAYPYDRRADDREMRAWQASMERWRGGVESEVESMKLAVAGLQARQTEILITLERLEVGHRALTVEVHEASEAIAAGQREAVQDIKQVVRTGSESRERRWLALWGPILAAIISGFVVALVSVLVARWLA